MLAEFLIRLPHDAPVVLVCVGGLIAAGVNWSKARRPALLATLGLTMTLAARLGGSLAWAYLVGEIQRPGGAVNARPFMPAVGLVMTAASSVGFALVVAAVFVGRRPAPRSDDAD